MRISYNVVIVWFSSINHNIKINLEKISKYAAIICDLISGTPMVWWYRHEDKSVTIICLLLVVTYHMKYSTIIWGRCSTEKFIFYFIYSILELSVSYHGMFILSRKKAWLSVKTTLYLLTEERLPIRTYSCESENTVGRLAKTLATQLPLWPMTKLGH